MFECDRTCERATYLSTDMTHVLNAQDFLATTSFNDSIVVFLSVSETTGSCILMYVVLAGDGIQELSGSQSLAGF